MKDTEDTNDELFEQITSYLTMRLGILCYKHREKTMQLPYSEKLSIGYLSRLFDNTSNCYKFFWFQAILKKLKSDKTRFTFDELINEMIADAIL